MNREIVFASEFGVTLCAVKRGLLGRQLRKLFVPVKVGKLVEIHLMLLELFEGGATE